MQEAIKIPLLMLTFNRLDFTKQTLRALEKSGCRDAVKLIILDNGSTDGTLDFLRALQINMDFEVHVSGKNLGVDQPMNWLFETHPAEVWAKLDNDTIVPHGWLGKLLGEMKEFDLDVVAARHFTMAKNAQAVMEMVEREKKPVPDAAMGGTAVLIRKSFVEKHGTIAITDDIGVLDNWSGHCKKAFEAGARISFSPSVFVELLDMEAHGKKREGLGDYENWITRQRTEKKAIPYREAGIPVVPDDDILVRKVYPDRIVVVTKSGRKITTPIVKEKAPETEAVKEPETPSAVTAVKNVRLNIGCGPAKIDGCINVDIDVKWKPDIVADATKKLPYGDGAVVDIRAWHSIEHFDLAFTPDRLKGVFQEWTRVMAPGALLHIATPERAANLRLAMSGDKAAYGAIWGAAAWPHLFLWSEPEVEKALTGAGLKIVEKKVVREQPEHGFSLVVTATKE